MFRRLFGRSSPAQPDVTDWWVKAQAVADGPGVSSEAIAALRGVALASDQAPDLADAQQEFLEGLDALHVLQSAPALPVLHTQHRVIGSDTCHYLAPASLVDQVDSGGKVFVTSARLILAAGGVQQWAWHTVASVQRIERDLMFDIRGRPPVRLRFNSYESALVVAALARRLAQ